MVGAAELGFEFKAPVDVAEEGEDFFAQLNGNADEDDQTLQHLTDQSPPPKTPPHKEPPQPEAILQPLIDVTDDADPFAEIMQAEDEAPIAGLAGDTSAKPSGVVEDDVVIGTSQPHHTPPEEQNQAFPASHDLLAELGSPTEDDPFAEIAQAEPESPIPSAVPPAAHSVSDKSWDDLLEEFDEQSPIIPAESPVPDLSIENSREEPSPGQIDSGDVSMSSAWLADSTMDDSFQIGVDDRDVPGMSGPEEVVKGETPVDEPLSFDVPEGWYDDQGVFQWYSPEEKEQVRQAMLGQDVAPAPVSGMFPFHRNSRAHKCVQSHLKPFKGFQVTGCLKMPPAVPLNPDNRQQCQHRISMPMLLHKDCNHPQPLTHSHTRRPLHQVVHIRPNRRPMQHRPCRLQLPRMASKVSATVQLRLLRRITRMHRLLSLRAIRTLPKHRLYRQ